MELFFLRFAKIPFTCSYLPGGAQRVLFWPLYMIGFAVYLLAATKVETWLPVDSGSLLYFYTVVVTVWMALLYRNVFIAAGTVYFEEESTSDPTYLNMRS
jgi:hypothetical protein